MTGAQTLPRIAAAEQAEVGPAIRAFVRDSDSETVIRESLDTLGIGNALFTAGGMTAAVEALSSEKSPRLLILDISGINDPLLGLRALAEVCDPTTIVIAIGERNDITLYRELKSTGIADYFVKPLFQEPFSGACRNILFPEGSDVSRKTGMLIFVLGVRGGVGATSIATSTAWSLAKSKRHTALVDLGLQLGDAALQLDATPGHALCEALDNPERVDKLFLERGLKEITDRLSLLASLEPLNSDITLSEGSILWLLDKLLPRYRITMVEVPPGIAKTMIWALRLPSICLLISSASLTGARDLARWNDAIGANTPVRRTITIVNHVSPHGGLNNADFVQASGISPGVTIPYSRDFAKAAAMGIKATEKCASFQRSLAPIVREITGDVFGTSPSFFARVFGRKV